MCAVKGCWQKIGWLTMLKEDAVPFTGRRMSGTDRVLWSW